MFGGSQAYADVSPEGMHIVVWPAPIGKRTPRDAFRLAYEVARDSVESKFEFLLDVLEEFPAFPDVALDAWVKCEVGWAEPKSMRSYATVRHVLQASDRGIESVAAELRNRLIAELVRVVNDGLAEIAALEQFFNDRSGAPVLLEIAKDVGPLQVLREVLIICAGVRAAEIAEMDDSSNERARMLLREDEQLGEDNADGSRSLHLGREPHSRENR